MLRWLHISDLHKKKRQIGRILKRNYFVSARRLEK